MKTAPILMTEEYWANSQLSIARYYGGIAIGKIDYRIVNKEGISLFELSDPESKHYVGDDKKAIEPGEPADLVQKVWIPIYRKFERGTELSCYFSKGFTYSKKDLLFFKE